MKRRLYRFQELRKRAGYSSAEEFARAHGIPSRRWVAYEQERYLPHIENLIEIADMLGASIDELLGHRPLPVMSPAERELTDDERELVRDFSGCNLQGRSALLRLGELLGSRTARIDYEDARDLIKAVFRAMDDKRGGR